MLVCQNKFPDRRPIFHVVTRNRIDSKSSFFAEWYSLSSCLHQRKNTSGEKDVLPSHLHLSIDLSKTHSVWSLQYELASSLCDTHVYTPTLSKGWSCGNPAIFVFPIADSKKRLVVSASKKAQKRITVFTLLSRSSRPMVVIHDIVSWLKGTKLKMLGIIILMCYQFLQHHTHGKTYRFRDNTGECSLQPAILVQFSSTLTRQKSPLEKLLAMATWLLSFFARRINWSKPDGIHVGQERKGSY